MTFRHVKAAVAFFVFDNADMWGHAKKRRRGGRKDAPGLVL
jgi:hypothetical protein